MSCGTFCSPRFHIVYYDFDWLPVLLRSRQRLLVLRQVRLTGVGSYAAFTALSSSVLRGAGLCPTFK